MKTTEELKREIEECKARRAVIAQEIAAHDQKIAAHDQKIAAHDQKIAELSAKREEAVKELTAKKAEREETAAKIAFVRASFDV